MPEYLPKTMELFPNFYSIPGWIAGRVLAAKSSQIIYKWQLILQRHNLLCLKWVPTKSLKNICSRKSPSESSPAPSTGLKPVEELFLVFLLFCFAGKSVWTKVRVWFNDHFSPLIFTHKGIEVLGPLVWVPAPKNRRDSPKVGPTNTLTGRLTGKVSPGSGFLLILFAWANSRVHGI